MDRDRQMGAQELWPTTSTSSQSPASVCAMRSENCASRSSQRGRIGAGVLRGEGMVHQVIGEKAAVVAPPRDQAGGRHRQPGPAGQPQPRPVSQPSVAPDPSPPPARISNCASSTRPGRAPRSPDRATTCISRLSAPEPI